MKEVVKNLEIGGEIKVVVNDVTHIEFFLYHLTVPYYMKNVSFILILNDNGLSVFINCSCENYWI